jgi:hypothetical protein
MDDDAACTGSGTLVDLHIKAFPAKVGTGFASDNA